MNSKPIFVIGSPNNVIQSEREVIRDKMSDYHVLFYISDSFECKLFSIKETIELTDLKQVQDYICQSKP
jgi:hypothetical protein